MYCFLDYKISNEELNNIINLIGGNGWSYMMLFSIESL